MNKDSLYYLERMDAFEIMETHIMDRVMQEYWQSNLDASGHFLSASTTFTILTHISARLTDCELEHRFYKTRSPKLGKHAHKLSFTVVMNSMQVRYFLEMLIFFCLVVYMQYGLYRFSLMFNKAMESIAEVQTIFSQIDAGT